MGALSFFGFTKAQPAFPLVQHAAPSQAETVITDDAATDTLNEQLQEALDTVAVYQTENDFLQTEVARREAETHRLMQMLDNVSNVVMLCDTTHANQVFYMNKVALEVFAKHRTALNSDLRGADVANAQGHSIHQFHKNPERIRHILAQPNRMPHHADIPIGGTVFRTSTYPIWDSQEPDKVLCFMACWTDVTTDKLLAEEQAKVQERQHFLEQHVSEIAAAMHQMSATVVEVAKNTQLAATSTEGVSENAAGGQQIVQQAVSAMQQITAFVRSSAEIVARLGEKSEHIGKIVEVIDEIADQTNLLALNAAIEAARASEHGRGFAVVATEVQKLAERTRNATQDIGHMVGEIQTSTSTTIQTMEQGQQQVQTGEEASRKAEQALTKIVSEIESVRMMITQIAAATEEQAAATHQITRTVEQLTHR